MPKPALRAPSCMIAGAIAIALSCRSVATAEVPCEDAVSRLEECCPDLNPARLNCDPGGCGSGQTIVLEEKAAECIRDRDCDDLRSRGTCAELKRLSLLAYPSTYISAITAEACK